MRGQRDRREQSKQVARRLSIYYAFPSTPPIIIQATKITKMLGVMDFSVNIFKHTEKLKKIKPNHSYTHYLDFPINI